MNMQEKLDKANTLVKKLRENAAAESRGTKQPHELGSFNNRLKEAEAYRTFLKNINGDLNCEHPTIHKSLKEMVTSTDVIQMVPKIIQGQMIEAADPEYLAVNFFNKVQVPNGNSLVVLVPIIGEIFVTEVGESDPYNEDSVDYTLGEKNGLQVKVKKYGVKVSITEEAIADSTWDLYNTNIRKIGQAFGRCKEQLCMAEFSKHGHVIFDNDIREQSPGMGTTGRAEDGSFNNTLSVEDFLDLILAAIAHRKNPTDCIMHPLTWTVFARNSMIGAGLTWGALGGADVHPNGATQGTGGFAGMQNNMGPQKLILTPQQTQNRLPIPLTMHFSPWVKFDKERRLFDMYVIDRNNVGVIAQREDLSISNWNDMERDVRYIRGKERYGVGMHEDTNGVMVACNIAVATSYPKPPVVTIRQE